MGTVKSFDVGTDGGVFAVKVEFDGIGVHSIERTDVDIELSKNLFATIRQFPLVLSYGVTIHKSQGLQLILYFMNKTVNS